MATFRILHVSDLHLAQIARTINFIDTRSVRQHAVLAYKRLRGSSTTLRYRRPTSHDPAAVYNLAAHLYQNPDVDLILITGDIATTGDLSDQQTAHELLTAQPEHRWTSAHQRPTLRGAMAPVAILPGNHDRYTRIQFPFGTAGAAFDAVFREYWPAGQDAFEIGVLRKEGEWLGIVGADFTLRKGDATDALAQTGEGEVYQDILANLRSRTREMRDQIETRTGARVAIIWAVHFAPAFKGCKPLLGLRNEDALLTAAKEEQVFHILCGHTHESRTYALQVKKTYVHIYCAGTAAAYDAKHGNFIHSRDVKVLNGEIQGDIRTSDHQMT